MIKKRQSQGHISQADIIRETESTYLIRDNIKPILDVEGNIETDSVKYDEYVIEKQHFSIIERLALANFPPIKEHEEIVFEILREQNGKESS